MPAARLHAQTPRTSAPLRSALLAALLASTAARAQISDDVVLTDITEAYSRSFGVEWEPTEAERA
jgi:hypothetical protein